MRDENKKPFIIIGVIAGLAFGVYLFVKEPDESTFEKIALTVTMTWILINGMTYRGRYRPRSVYALKICYPLFLFLLLMTLTGRM